MPTLKGQSPFCRKHAQKGAAAQRLISPLTGWEPHYMPSVYNNEQKIQHNHNCFAYAFDVIDMPACKDDKCKFPFHQPGYKAGHPRFSDDGKKYCGDLLMRLFADMPFLKKTTFTTQCPPGHSKIALVIDPQNDYHFYRQDSNGLWSHKPGGQKVTNLDSEGKLIYNPELCSRDYRTREAPKKDELNYSVFCSFLCVPRNRPAETKRGGYSRMAGGRRTLKKRRVGGGRTSARQAAKKEAAAHKAAQEASAAQAAAAAAAQEAAAAAAAAAAGVVAPQEAVAAANIAGHAAAKATSASRRSASAAKSTRKTLKPSIYSTKALQQARLEAIGEATGTGADKQSYVAMRMRQAAQQKIEEDLEEIAVRTAARQQYPGEDAAAKKLRSEFIARHYRNKKMALSQLGMSVDALAEQLAGLNVGAGAGAGAGAGGHPAAAPAYPAAAAGADNLAATFAAWSLGPPGGR